MKRFIGTFEEGCNGMPAEAQRSSGRLSTAGRKNCNARCPRGAVGREAARREYAPRSTTWKPGGRDATPLPSPPPSHCFCKNSPQISRQSASRGGRDATGTQEVLACRSDRATDGLQGARNGAARLGAGWNGLWHLAGRNDEQLWDRIIPHNSKHRRNPVFRSRRARPAECVVARAGG